MLHSSPTKHYSYKCQCHSDDTVLLTVIIDIDYIGVCTVLIIEQGRINCLSKLGNLSILFISLIHECERHHSVWQKYLSAKSNEETDPPTHWENSLLACAMNSRQKEFLLDPRSVVLVSSPPVAYFECNARRLTKEEKTDGFLSGHKGSREREQRQLICHASTDENERGQFGGEINCIVPVTDTSEEDLRRVLNVREIKTG